MRRGLATGGLVAFVALDVALVGLALRPPTGDAGTPPRTVATSTTSTAGQVRPTTATTAGTATPSGSATPSTPSTTTAPTTTTTTATTTKVTPLTVLVGALDDRRAWRATSGTCGVGGGRVETTTDAGQRWTRSPAPFAVVARVQPLASGRGFVVAGGTDCVLSQYSTVDGGGSWLAPGTVAGGWSRLPASPTAALTPEAPRSRPCGDEQVADLARVGATTAQVLCADGTVRRTTTGGATWSTTARVTNALAVGSRVEGGDVVTYAARTDPSCAGVSVTRVTTGRAREVACVAASGVEPGRVALSVVPSAGWLVVGDRTWVSGPALTSWTRS